ncbi:PREDICTED: isochorismatase domain-containing protein 1-like [Priapulus caudatus]|uniref:Isochorismatase domain-containing protein 1 n=1 Tax=Priapulus caudatus TaxID=37621 RepID=A0ABM1FBG3_PRICU|nr:PREDICTED: isochorismatase domain-containing protein 1-like [Priapulus caudatus]
MAAPTKGFGNLIQNQTVFFMCDIQERFRPHIKYFEDIVEVSKRMVQAAKILDIPLIITEQYPKGLGNTVSELDVTGAVGVWPKVTFSMLIPEVKKALPTLCGGKPKSVILFGLETHVCVQQTAFDLIAVGYDVHVLADGSSSRSQMDRNFAFERLRQCGCYVSTSETVLLQLVGGKDHAMFKDIQAVIREPAPVSGLVPCPEKS